MTSFNDLDQRPIFQLSFKATKNENRIFARHFTSLYYTIVFLPAQLSLVYWSTLRLLWSYEKQSHNALVVKNLEADLGVWRAYIHFVFSLRVNVSIHSLSSRFSASGLRQTDLPLFMG